MVVFAILALGVMVFAGVFGTKISPSPSLQGEAPPPQVFSASQQDSLERLARALPARDVEGNLRAWRQLLLSDPSSRIYQQKVDLYEARAAGVGRGEALAEAPYAATYADPEATRSARVLGAQELVILTGETETTYRARVAGATVYLPKASVRSRGQIALPRIRIRSHRSTSRGRPGRPSVSSYSGSRGNGYYLGPRGGCYTYTASGNKRYVDRSLCH